MSPEQLATVILAIAGVVLQLVFRYAPKASEWYAAQADKGILMLGFVVVVGLVYFGLSCTPFAAELGIGLSCNTSSVFSLFKAIFVIAGGQSLAYLYTGKK